MTDARLEANMPLPHEPVSYHWRMIDGVKMSHPIEWPWDQEARDERVLSNDVACVTLANGQRIVVRAK